MDLDTLKCWSQCQDRHQQSVRQAHACNSYYTANDFGLITPRDGRLFLSKLGPGYLRPLQGNKGLKTSW